MCGIVGYSGNSDAIEPVMEGLSRLEYRGYDSAGICLNNSTLEIYKKEGKLENLKTLLAEIKPHGTTAIGHTRWATHGIVNALNAHPHGSEDLALVHNGIIENASDIKSELKGKYTFKSDTDTESFLALISVKVKEGVEIKKAIVESFKMLNGNSAFVIMERGKKTLYSIKRSAPLVCGENVLKNEVFASSDPYALIGFTDKVYFPGDEILCVSDIIDGKSLTKFYDLNLNESSDYQLQKKEMNLDSVSKGNFEHFMLKEIHEQPNLLNRVVEYYQDEGKKHLEEFSKVKTNYIHINACGTAWHAGLLIKHYFESINKTRCNVDLASEFRYRSPIMNKNDIGLFISQSGETADTLATMELCNEAGLKTFSIVNTEGSTLFRNCDENFLIKAGQEIGVASTKAFTQQVITGYLMAHAFNGDILPKVALDKISTLSQRINNIISRSNEIQLIAEKLHKHKGYIFTGRGPLFPIALEGALKVKEIAYVHAEGYAAGELKHGPIALIDENMVNIALVIDDHLYEKTVSNVEEVKARRGVVVTVGPENDKKLELISDFYIGLNFKGLEELSPILSNVVLQLFSYYIAKLKGTDIDKPRNLAKSVTVE